MFIDTEKKQRNAARMKKRRATVDGASTGNAYMVEDDALWFAQGGGMAYPELFALAVLSTTSEVAYNRYAEHRDYCEARAAQCWFSDLPAHEVAMASQMFGR